MPLKLSMLREMGKRTEKRFWFRVRDTHNKIEEIITQYPNSFISQKVKEAMDELAREALNIEREYYRKKAEKQRSQTAIDYYDDEDDETVG